MADIAWAGVADVLEVFVDNDTSECWSLLGDVFELAPNFVEAEGGVVELLLLDVVEEVQAAGEEGCCLGLVTGEGCFTCVCVEASSIRPPVPGRRSIGGVSLPTMADT